MIDEFKEQDEMQEHIRQLIENSSVVARCAKRIIDDCENEISQAEIDLGTADLQTCSRCVMIYAAEQFDI